jgi:hypothetical protein
LRSEQPVWKRTTFLLTVSLVVVAVLAPVAIWQWAGGDDHQRIAPAAAAKTSSSCGYSDGDEVPSEPPADARWVAVGNGEAPEVEGVGPGRVGNGVHSCFARSPLGAVLAAMWWILDSSNPDVNRELLAESRIIEDGRARDLIASSPPDAGIGDGHFAGFSVLGIPTPDVVEVDILARASRSSPVYPAHRILLVWQHGDWVMNEGPNEGTIPITDNDLPRFVRWQQEPVDDPGRFYGETSTEAAPVDPEGDECRSEWTDLAQLHSENGNPGGPVPAVETRWELVADEASRLADEASRDDCGAKIADFATTWAALEGFQYDLADFDPAADLAIAENDLQHFLGLQGTTELPPGGPLERAFRIIRRETPLAIADLEPALVGAADLDLEDRTAVTAFLRKADRIKWESVHVQRMVDSYHVIGDAELHEE